MDKFAKVNKIIITTDIDNRDILLRFKDPENPNIIFKSNNNKEFSYIEIMQILSFIVINTADVSFYDAAGNEICDVLEQIL